MELINIFTSSILTTFGLIFSYWGIKRIRIYISSYFWPAVNAKFDSKEFNYRAVQKSPDAWPSSSNMTMQYFANITYSYEVGGEKFNIKSTLSSFDLKRIQNALRTNDAVKNQIKIFYNPKDPGECLAEHDRSLIKIFVNLILLIVSLFILLWGLSSIVPFFRNFNLLRYS